jgi:hypothetical protein
MVTRERLMLAMLALLVVVGGISAVVIIRHDHSTPDLVVHLLWRS